MGLFKLSALFLLLSQVYSEDTINAVQTAFLSNEIVPNVYYTTPESLLNVNYSDTNIVSLGNELPVLSVLHQPTFGWDADSNYNYTLFMIGYPVQPEINLEIAKNVRHMAIINIPGSDVSSGYVLTEYLQPSPPPLSGSQRYTFLEFKQANYLDLTTSFIEKYSLLNRFNFNLTEFAITNNLTLESGNFFTTKFSSILSIF